MCVNACAHNANAVEQKVETRESCFQFLKVADNHHPRQTETWSRDFLFPQSQAVVVDGCGQQLQQLSLFDRDKKQLLLLEEEKQRVAALRRMQIESEQFRYFEDQLRRQELANRRGEEAGEKVKPGSTVLLLIIILLV